MSLEEGYANDAELLEFYKKKLLKPGWAGELDRDELDYIRSQLQRSSALKRKWGFRPSAKRIPEKRIRAVARDGVRAFQRRVLASVEAKETDKGNNYRREKALSHTDRRTGPGNQLNLRNGDWDAITKADCQSNRHPRL